MSEPITITIDPPLPCCALIAIRRRCGQPATVVQASRLGDGSYQMQPFCRQCVAGMAKNYGVDIEEQQHED